MQTLTRPGGAQTIYEYNDPLKRLTALINNDASTQLVNRFDYAYSDAAHPDQRSSETVTNGEPFSFPQNELTTYEHNSLNQLISTTAPEKLFTYDDAGNMTHGYTPDGYQFTATYGAENRLASIEYTNSGSTVHKAEYIYSGYGFLAQIKKYENGTPVGDIRIMRLGYLAIQERDASNQVVSEYTWGLNMGGGIGGLLNMRQSGNDYQYLYDGRANVSALLNTSQQVAASYRYDSFGNLMAKTGTLDQPFMFSTKRYDAGTGLSYYGYRFYNPSIGKWLTRDPLGEAGGINLYAACLNDPVNKVDPFGLEVLLSDSSFGEGFGLPPSIFLPSEQFLSNTQDIATIFFIASAVSVNIIGEAVFGAIGITAGGLKIAFYSDTPCNDTVKEGVKMAIPSPPATDPIMDEIVDQVIDWYINEYNLPIL